MLPRNVYGKPVGFDSLEFRVETAGYFDSRGLRQGAVARLLRTMFISYCRMADGEWRASHHLLFQPQYLAS